MLLPKPNPLADDIVPGQVYPLWRVARLSGRTEPDLIELCDAGRIVGAQWRDVPTIPTGGVWWAPIPPIVLDEEGNETEAAAPAGALEGLLPLWMVADRDGVKQPTLTRLCREGRVNGARKISGCWFIPSSTRVVARRPGRRPNDILKLPQWLTPTNG